MHRPLRGDRTPARLRVSRRRSTPPTGGLLSIDPAMPRGLTFPWRSRSYESVNASCPVVSTQGLHLASIEREGMSRSAGFHPSTPLDDTGVRPALEHAIYATAFLRLRRRNEPDASWRASMSRTAKWRGGPRQMERDVPGGRSAARTASRHLSRIASRRRRAVSLPRRNGTPGVDGSLAERLQRDLARLALRCARIVGASGAQPRALVCRAEYAGRDQRRGAEVVVL